MEDLKIIKPVSPSQPIVVSSLVTVEKPNGSSSLFRVGVKNSYNCTNKNQPGKYKSKNI